MISCPSCGQTHPDDAPECLNCGLVFAKWNLVRKRASSKSPGSSSVSPKTAALIVAVALGSLGYYAWRTLGTAARPNDAELIANENLGTAENYESWYPSDITPPSGTQYPCALTALPKELAGIPASHHRYIDHAYSLILQAVQAKLLVYDGLGSAEAPAKQLDEYLNSMREIERRLMAEEAPKSLEPFRDDVVAALNLQMAFFTKAYDERRAGRSFQQVLEIPEGRSASQHLSQAWSKMSQRYPAMTADVKDSMYHHLCALDLF